MIGASKPFLYGTGRGHNAAFFPTSTFDPKAVTRASWKPKPRKPSHYGPLLSFNIPAKCVSDHHSVTALSHALIHCSRYALPTYQARRDLSCSAQLKNCIKWLRVVQLLCRISEFTGALSISVLLVFVRNIDEVTGWILRILVRNVPFAQLVPSFPDSIVADKANLMKPGVAMLHCLYAIYHLSRKASGRSPGSSAAYHVFAAILDLVILSLHVFGASSTYQESSTWRSRLSDQDFVRYFASAIYYIVIIVGGMHLTSLLVSSWLGIIFRRISLMPPDMNPLEANLTARPLHKRNRSSVTTVSSAFEGTWQLASEAHQSPLGFESNQGSPAPLAPFRHTKDGSYSSLGSHHSLINLPNRQYQILPQNLSRGSIYAASSTGHKTDVHSAKANSEQILQREENSMINVKQTRLGGRTKTGMLAVSPMMTVGHRGCTMAKGNATSCCENRSEAVCSTLAQIVKEETVSVDSVYHGKHNVACNKPNLHNMVNSHTNPLHSHPAANLKCKEKAIPFADNVDVANREYIFRTRMNKTSENKNNSYHVNDQNKGTQRPWKRLRNSSAQLAEYLHSRSYENLKSNTPPILVGGDRKISSGVDYGRGNRRNFSDKTLEEGQQDH